MNAPTPISGATDLITDRDNLVQRLEDGDRKISLAKANGGDVSRLETFWIQLLHEYEETCQAIARGETRRLQPAA